MKSFLIFLFAVIIAPVSYAQEKLTSTVFNGDTTVSTDFETLNTLPSDGKTAVADKVVGVRNISGKKSDYWLFFYFTPYDIQASGVSVSSRNYAYLKTTAGKWYRIQYQGKPYYYNTKSKVGFFINITDYVTDLKDQEITEVRLETSVLYHTIKLNEESKKRISAIINALYEWRQQSSH